MIFLTGQNWNFIMVPVLLGEVAQGNKPEITCVLDGKNQVY
ncbi:MAG: hypothetical protein U0T82_08730 [Bacteroidales bacterium]